MTGAITEEETDMRLLDIFFGLSLWRRAVLSVLVLGLLGAGSYLASQVFWLKVVLAAEQQPYQVLLRDRIFVAESGSFREVNLKDRLTFLRARRADGSRAEITFQEFQDFANYKVMNKKLFLIPNRTITTSFARAGAKSTTQLSEKEAAGLKQGRADRSCRSNGNLVTQAEYLGDGEHLGYRVVKHRLSSQTTRSEIWEAVDLDCEAIWIRTEFLGAGGAVSDVTLKEAIWIDRGESPGFVFEEDSFVESPPSGLLRADQQAAAAEAGVSASAEPAPELSEKLRRLDEAYYRRRPAQ